MCRQVGKMKPLHAQILCAVGVCLTMMPYAQSGTWLMIALPELLKSEDGLRLTSDQVGWLTGTAGFFFIIGGVAARYLTDLIGRRNSLIFFMVPYILAYAVNEINTFNALICGRALIGIAAGSIPVMTLYLGEIASAEVRGSLSCIATIVGDIGSLLMVLVNPFITLHVLHFGLLATCVIIVFIMLLIPESPYYHVANGKNLQAERTLHKLRSRDQVPSELAAIQKYADEKSTEKSSFMTLWRNNGARRAFIVNLWLALYIQLCGTSAIKDYTGVIFENVGFPLDRDYELVISFAISAPAVFLCTLFIDTVGRRLLLFLANGLLFIALAMLATFFLLKEHNWNVNDYTWIPLISVILVRISKEAGLRPIAYTLMSEYYPLNVKAVGASVVSIIAALTSSIMSKLFQELTDLLGFGPVLFVCLCNLTVGATVMYFVMPETKNLSLMEVEQLFNKNCK